MIARPNYDELKNLYNEFKKNPPKQEFNRWLEEFKYSADLLEFAKKGKSEKRYCRILISKRNCH